MTTRLLSILLFFTGHILYSQIGDTTRFDPDTKQKMVMVVDSLKGDWLLVNKLTISKDKNDTINQIVSDKSKFSTQTNRPKIILSFKNNGDLVITEFPFGKKSIVTRAKWKVEARPFDEIDSFFIEIYKSDNIELTKEFNAFVTGLDLKQFQLTEKSWRHSDKNWYELNFVRH